MGCGEMGIWVGLEVQLSSIELLVSVSVSLSVSSVWFFLYNNLGGQPNSLWMGTNTLVYLFMFFFLKYLELSKLPLTTTYSFLDINASWREADPHRAIAWVTALLLVLQDTDLFVFSSRFYDTSKQAIGSLFIHFANVFLSDLTEEDPCSL